MKKYLIGKYKFVFFFFFIFNNIDIIFKIYLSLRNWRNNKYSNSNENNFNNSQGNETILELKIKNKALENKNFPSEAIIEEFLKVPTCPEVIVKWTLPNIEDFVVCINFKIYFIMSSSNFLNILNIF